MRGPIGAELKTLARLWPERAIFFTPAYPKLGRTVSNGCVFVNGVPLDRTGFAHDPTHPARTSSVAGMLDEPIVVLPGASAIPDHPAPGHIYMFDAATDADLDAAIRVLAERKLLGLTAGSGGFAAGLARMLPVDRNQTAPLPRAARPIVVSGSMHPISAEQLRHAGAWPVLECSGFPNGHHGLAQMAAAARQRIGRDSIDTMIVFGGDTAHAVMCALGVRQIEPMGEALPGIPISSIAYQNRTLTLITKAGGFGGPDLLPQLAAALHMEI
jgi:uncharacterized protein YgbK (DUF1537 family)